MFHDEHKVTQNLSETYSIFESQLLAIWLQLVTSWRTANINQKLCATFWHFNELYLSQSDDKKHEKGKKFHVELI